MQGWDQPPGLSNAQLVLYFGGREQLRCGERFRELKQRYPTAHLLGCSTGGEIIGSRVLDDSVVTAAIEFTHTTLRPATVPITRVEDSTAAGHALADMLMAPDLRHVFILSEGVHVNGSALIDGIYEVLPRHVTLTGGLAGDGPHFRQTIVGVDTQPKERTIAAIGLYGDAIHVTYGSASGWEPFGPERTITRSKGAVLYELDGKPALDVYKQYIGADAEHLPGSALAYPISIRPTHESEHEIMRSVVGINEYEKTILFAGDVPTGHIAQLMCCEFDMAVDAAGTAAERASSGQGDNSFAILVSCISRKLLFMEKITEEINAVADVFAGKVPTIGFYSGGELCPQQTSGQCCLHNHTMTITMLSEK